MSFLEVFKQKQQAGFGKSFTEQATEMKAALTGKAAEPAAIEKSNIAEQVAQAQTEEQKTAVLEQARQTQEKGQIQYAELQQQKKATSAEYQQKKSDLIKQVQRQATSIYTELANNYANLSVKEKEAQLNQLEFLHNMADKQYIDKIQIEGDRRRLDNENQLKTAMLYAAFEDKIGLLESDINFKRAMLADQRTFDEMLSKIDPQAALEAAVMAQQSENRQKALQGIGQALQTYVKD